MRRDSPDETVVEGSATVMDPKSDAAALARELRRQGYSIAVIAGRLKDERHLSAPDAEAVVRRVFREPIRLSRETRKARLVVAGLILLGSAVLGAAAYAVSRDWGWFELLLGGGALLVAIHMIRGVSRLRQ